jgi:hypothetical protein
MAMMAMPMGSGAVQLNQLLLNDGTRNYAGGVGHVTASGGIIKFFTISGSATVRSTGQAGERQAERPRCVRVLAPSLRACNRPDGPANKEYFPFRPAVLLERRRRPVFREGVARRGKVPGRAGRYGKGVGGPRRFHQDRRNTAPRRWPILPRHDAYGSEERGSLALGPAPRCVSMHASKLRAFESTGACPRGCVCGSFSR